MNDAAWPEQKEGDGLQLKHINTLIRYHYKIDPMDLVTEGLDGELNYDKYVQTWAGLEWVLKREQKMRMAQQ